MNTGNGSDMLTEPLMGSHSRMMYNSNHYNAVYDTKDI